MTSLREIVAAHFHIVDDKIVSMGKSPDDLRQQYERIFRHDSTQNVSEMTFIEYNDFNNNLEQMITRDVTQRVLNQIYNLMSSDFSAEYLTFIYNSHEIRCDHCFPNPCKCEFETLTRTKMIVFYQDEYNTKINYLILDLDSSADPLSATEQIGDVKLSSSPLPTQAELESYLKEYGNSIEQLANRLGIEATIKLFSHNKI